MLVLPPVRWYDNSMNRNDFSAAPVSSPLQWLKVYCLYRRAFPRKERKPFGIIRAMHRRGKTDVWVMCLAGRFAGFAATINDSDLILLDYLAVPEKLRGCGIGSMLLSALKRHYAGKGLFVEIESAFEAGPDLGERIRRRRFYLNNGMQSAQVMAGVFGVDMELLCWNCNLDFERYSAFYRDNYSPWAASNLLEKAYPHQD